MKKELIQLSNRSRIGIALALSAISGGLMFLSYPPVNVWPLIWVAIIPYLVAQYRFMPRRWAALAPTITTTLFLWPYLARIFGIPGAPFLIKNMGLLFGLVTFVTSSERKFNELTKYKWFVLQGMFAWVGFEMIRSFIPVLGTIGFVANTQASQAWLTQPISIFSIYGLNFLIIMVNYSLAYLCLLWVDRKFVFDDAVAVDDRATRKWAVITLAVLVLWAGLSLILYTRPNVNPSVRVAALHHYVDKPGHQADEAEQKENFETFSAQARDAAGQGAKVIFLPELAFGFDPQEQYTEEFRSLAADTNAYLYIPYGIHEDDGWHNEAVLLSPQGEFTSRYGKLLAFGEPPTVTRGTFPAAETPFGTLGTIICMDGVFTDAARKVVGTGVQILGTPSYNSTVGISEHNWTHFVMRSVENQTPIVNADRGLVSVITDARGKVLAEVMTPAGSDTVLVADVKLGSASSPYLRVGDWLGWAALAGFVFFNVFQMVVEGRAKKAGKSG